MPGVSMRIASVINERKIGFYSACGSILSFSLKTQGKIKKILTNKGILFLYMKTELYIPISVPIEKDWRTFLPPLYHMGVSFESRATTCYHGYREQGGWKCCHYECRLCCRNENQIRIMPLCICIHIEICNATFD